MSNTSQTLGSALTGVVVAGLSLLYWEIRARSARVRQQSLDEQVTSNGQKLDRVQAAVVPTEESTSSGGES